MVYMLKSFFKDIFDMVICKRIVHNLAVLPELDKVAEPQGPELMRYSRLCHVEQETQVADAHLMAMQCPKDFHAGRVGESLVKFG